MRAFESAHRVSLPAEYRDFLLRVGNGGAGPKYGVYPLGTCDGKPLPEHVLSALSKKFDPCKAEDWEPRSRAHIMKGAMIVATEGCARWFWLVVSGPNAGEVWFDARADGHAPEQLLDDAAEPLTFRRWFDAWLHESATKWRYPKSPT